VDCDHGPHPPRAQDGQGAPATQPVWRVLHIRFYSILFYSILFYSIPFYSILFYFILFFSIYRILLKYLYCYACLLLRLFSCLSLILTHRDFKQDAKVWRCVIRSTGKRLCDETVVLFVPLYLLIFVLNLVLCLDCAVFLSHA
jgi:hypothetical protein